MGNFEETLERILNDPQAMGQIMSLAQSIGGPSDQEPAPSEPSASPPLSDLGSILDPKLLGGIAALMGQYNSSEDERVALLHALRPFVKEERYGKLDKAIQIAKLSRMARMAFELLRIKEAQDV